MGELRILSEDAVEITSFWRRMPKFFAYPFNATSVIYMISLSLVGAFMLRLSLMGVLIYLGCWVIFLRHAFAVLDRTSLGHLEPPEFASAASGEGSGRVFKQFGLLLVYGVLVGLVAVKIGPKAALTLAFGLNFLLPGGIMIIGVTDSLTKALNPLWYIMLLRSVGWAYLLMVVFLFLLTQGSFVALNIMVKIVPKFLAFPVLTMVQMYFTLIMFNMMGYVLYQYHDALGLDVEVQPEAHAKQSSGQSGLQYELGQLIAAGELQEALQLVEGHKRANWEDDQAHEQYRKVLLLADKPEQAANHAREYINKLLNEKKKMGRALGLYKECVERDAGFKLTDPEHFQALTKLATDTRDYPTAIALLKSFAAQFPKKPEAASALLQCAKISYEHLNDPAKAKQFAMYVRSKFEGQPAAEEARQYLKLIG